MTFSHNPVLLNEVLEFLTVETPRFYLDLTAGGGGHASAIIEKYPSVKAILIDRDPDAVAYLSKKFKENRNVTVVKAGFAELDKMLFLMQVQEVDLVFADLGVSSHQLDKAERGFSMQKEGPFDMRMDYESGITAFEYIKNSDEEKIKSVLSTFAQEREAGKVARVLKQCAEQGVDSTLQVADAIRKVKKHKKKGIDPATQVFMALRMAVNDELGQLESLLKKGFVKLAKNGVMGVITFHSTEDRVVKNFFRDRKNKVPYYIEHSDKVPYLFPEVSTYGPVSALKEETELNPRARSAKLRLISKSLIYN
ncbi:MAG: 16S rRNA (cytosine(1402)-N(4))-methyltransferase RsmH [bacterium]